MISTVYIKMPYKMRKAPKKDLYWVVDTTGDKYSKKPIPLGRAKKQIVALHINTGHGKVRPTLHKQGNMYVIEYKGHILAGFPTKQVALHELNRLNQPGVLDHIDSEFKRLTFTPADDEGFDDEMEQITRGSGRMRGGIYSDLSDEEKADLVRQLLFIERKAAFAQPINDDERRVLQIALEKIGEREYKHYLDLKVRFFRGEGYTDFIKQIKGTERYDDDTLRMAISYLVTMLKPTFVMPIQHTTAHPLTSDRSSTTTRRGSGKIRKLRGGIEYNEFLKICQETPNNANLYDDIKESIIPRLSAEQRANFGSIKYWLDKCASEYKTNYEKSKTGPVVKSVMPSKESWDQLKYALFPNKGSGKMRGGTLSDMVRRAIRWIVSHNLHFYAAMVAGGVIQQYLAGPGTQTVAELFHLPQWLLAAGNFFHGMTEGRDFVIAFEEEIRKQMAENSETLRDIGYRTLPEQTLPAGTESMIMNDTVLPGTPMIDINRRARRFGDAITREEYDNMRSSGITTHPLTREQIVHTSEYPARISGSGMPEDTPKPSWWTGSGMRGDVEEDIHLRGGMTKEKLKLFESRFPEYFINEKFTPDESLDFYRDIEPYLSIEDKLLLPPGFFERKKEVDMKDLGKKQYEGTRKDKDELGKLTAEFTKIIFRPGQTEFPPIQPTIEELTDRKRFAPMRARKQGSSKRLAHIKKYLKGMGIRATKKNIEHAMSACDAEGVVFD